MTIQNVVSANLRRLRMVRRLTQAELANRAGISLPGYRNMEAGKSAPRVPTLLAVADALSVGIQEIVTPVPGLKNVRFRSLKKLRVRDGILADAARWLEDFNLLEEILGDSTPCVLEGFPESGPSVSGLSPEKAAEKIRESFGRSWKEPIRDICGLLESGGVKVLGMSRASDAFFGLSIGPADGGPAVVVNTWDRIPVERWIFSAAHELGHLVLHRDSFDVDEPEERDREEEEASRFASAFLMPDRLFRKEWNETAGLPLVERVLKVKRMFNVSYKTVLYRLQQDDGDPQALWKRFYVEYKRRFGRSLAGHREPEALPAKAFSRAWSVRAGEVEPESLSRFDFTEDRLSALVRRAVGKEEISLGRAAEILGLNLEEMREIATGWEDT